MAVFDRRENNLLARLSQPDFALIEPDVAVVDLTKNERLVRPDDHVRMSWFPLSGIVSVVASTVGGDQAEVGLVGCEGMFAISTLHGIDWALMEIFCQLPGRAVRIPSAVLRAAMSASPSLRQMLIAYSYTFTVQTASSALAFATKSIEERLARWLLMSHDRIDGDEITMTHEAFALMLGVRRAGVTVAMQGLEAKGAIVTRRATAVVRDRRLLADIAGDAYGAAEAAYLRALGLPVGSPRLADGVAQGALAS